MNALNRRGFLQLLGGVVTAMAAKPMLALVPPPNIIGVPVPPEVMKFLTLDEINAFAFSFHAEVFPEHAADYRARALGCIQRIRARKSA